MVFQLFSYMNSTRHACAHVTVQGLHPGGGGTAIHGLATVKGMVFKQFTLG